MRRIIKGGIPQSLIDWVTNNPNSVYDDLSLLANNVVGYSIRQDIRSACALEQFYLCAYCCDRIADNRTSSHNEHIHCQADHSNLSLRFDNIVVSCNAKDSCGSYKANHAIALTPLMAECEAEVRYNLNGKVRHTSQRGQNLNSRTNLNCRRLVNRRAKLVEALIFEQITDTDELGLLDEEMIELIIEDLAIPGNDNKLPPFSPVLIRILRDLIA